MKESKMQESILTQKYLKECVEYNPETGIFTWKVRPKEHFKEAITGNPCKTWNTNRAGKIAGHMHIQGYWNICIDNKKYLAHRLVFLYMEGSVPERFADHQNQNRLDNRWVNLRAVDDIENCKNVGLRKDNESGHIGVHFDKQRQKWMSYVSVNKKRKHLGRFHSKEEAIKVREAASIKYNFHENHGT